MVVVCFWLYLILNVSAEAPSFSIIKTVCPDGVLKATLYKFPAILLPILTEPSGTNLEACPII
ncbi:hypothetical protein D3C80_1605420 [compost metagenome]